MDSMESYCFVDGDGRRKSVLVTRIYTQTTAADGTRNLFTWDDWKDGRVSHIVPSGQSIIARDASGTAQWMSGN